MAQESEAPLVPVEEKTVEFYEDRIVAVEVEEDGRRRIYVPMRPIVEYLGLAWSSQLQRIRRDPVLSNKAAGVFITNTPTDDSPSGGTQEMMCLPIEMLHGWLFGITVSRIKEELRRRLRGLTWGSACSALTSSVCRPVERRFIMRLSIQQGKR